MMGAIQGMILMSIGLVIGGVVVAVIAPPGHRLLASTVLLVLGAAGFGLVYAFYRFGFDVIYELFGWLGAVLVGGLWVNHQRKRWRGRRAAGGPAPEVRPREGSTSTTPRRPMISILRALWPWLLVAVIGLVGAWFVRGYLNGQRGAEPLVWRAKRAVWLAAGGLLVGLIAFHLQRRRTATMGFSQVGLVGARGLGAWLSDLPSVLRVLAIASLAVGLARPETYRTVIHQEDSVDIMIVFDMSKSMEETDLPRDRMDAAQRVIRRFLRRTKHDRVGLVIFGQQAMLQCPLTSDTKLVEQIVTDLVIGDVPELGTAIGDGLALALAQLRRSDAKSKVVILLSDGDNNWVTRFEPDEAGRAAAAMKVKVYTVLVGREESDLFGGMSVNPATLRSIATITGGEFYRATDADSFDRGFQAVRKKLDTTKRERKERIPDKQLFVILAAIAGLLIALELVLSHTLLRRLP